MNLLSVTTSARAIPEGLVNVSMGEHPPCGFQRGGYTTLHALVAVTLHPLRLRVVLAVLRIQRVSRPIKRCAEYSITWTSPC
jgi:hypothetical protein